MAEEDVRVNGAYMYIEHHRTLVFFLVTPNLKKARTPPGLKCYCLWRIVVTVSK